MKGGRAGSWGAVTIGVLMLSSVPATRVAHAAGAAAIPVRDLPRFPDLATDEEKFIGVAVAGAAEADEDVVVGASKREQSLGTVASAVTIVSGERLRRFGYRTLAEALESVVGLYIVDDRTVERLGIRGVQLLGDANTRILVLVDGSPVNEPWSQYVDTSWALPVHLDDVARIEVIRGPVSSIYGTNAFLGIINIVTLEADKAPRAYGRAGVASFGQYAGNAGFGYGSLNRQVRGTISFVTREGESVEYPEFAESGETPLTRADGSVGLNGSVTVNFDHLFFHVRGYDRTRELPGAPYDSMIGSTENENRDRQLLVEAGYSQPFGERFTLATRVYVDRYQFQGDLLLTPTLPGDPYVPFTTVGNALWYGGEVRGVTDILPRGKLNLTTGVAAEWSQTDSESTTSGAAPMTVNVDTDFNIQGLYAEANAAPFSWLAATGGVRYDVNSLFENRLSPRGALFFKKDESYGIKFLFAKGFRNPSVFEAFYKDGARYQPSEDSLFPEDITSYEVVLWGRPFPGLNLRLSGWQWDLEKIIEKQSVYDPTVLAERLQYKNIFVGLRSRGIELETNYRNTSGWLGFLNATLAEVKRDPGEFETDAVNAPELTANLGVSSPLLVGRVHLSSELGFISSRHTRDESIDADAFMRWNVVAYAPNLSGFDVTIGVRNLLDQREQIPAQSDYDRAQPAPGGVKVYLIPGAGREIFARVGYRF